MYHRAIENCVFQNKNCKLHASPACVNKIPSPDIKETRIYFILSRLICTSKVAKIEWLHTACCTIVLCGYHATFLNQLAKMSTKEGSNNTPP